MPVDFEKGKCGLKILIRLKNWGCQWENQNRCGENCFEDVGYRVQVLKTIMSWHIFLHHACSQQNLESVVSPRFYTDGNWSVIQGRWLPQPWPANREKELYYFFGGGSSVDKWLTGGKITNNFNTRIKVLFISQFFFNKMLITQENTSLYNDLSPALPLKGRGSLVVDCQGLCFVKQIY